ncbi:DUF3558 domain-containing protein [Saccharopolyspora hattusasensis]|uniref:DUF3558 domain-containing protein n=1 Tax=Saccharopolyspora hattusasensis TaxID=1128679 RepID=UPI003D96802A
MRTMRRTRSAVAFGLFAAGGLLLAGCGGAGGSSEATSTGEAPKSSALASFDPCAVLTPEELRSFGVDPDVKKDADKGLGEVGCKFMGHPFVPGLTKSEKDDLAAWEQRRSNFDKLEPNTVTGRKGLVGITNGSTDKGVCRQILEAGGGSVTVQVTYTDPETGKTNDPCADATKVAEAVAPKIPQLLDTDRGPGPSWSGASVCVVTCGNLPRVACKTGNRVREIGVPPSGEVSISHEIAGAPRTSATRREASALVIGSSKLIGVE